MRRNARDGCNDRRIQRVTPVDQILFMTNQIGQRVIASGTHYAAVNRGELIALVGSAGLLEISAREASAAEITGATRGTGITVERV